MTDKPLTGAARERDLVDRQLGGSYALGDRELRARVASGVVRSPGMTRAQLVEHLDARAAGAKPPHTRQAERLRAEIHAMEQLVGGADAAQRERLEIAIAERRVALRRL